MLSAIKRALGGGGGGAAAAATEAACAGCDPAILSKCKVSPEDMVGTVTPHSAHVFIKLAAPATAAADATDEAWWPESVDQEPAMVAVNEAIKAAGDAMPGKVKVTAYDSLSPSSPEPGTADAYVFPAGMYARGVPLEALPAVLVAVLQGEAPSTDAFEAEMVPGITLFVCCHAARDERCGHIGLPLAAKLAALAEAAGLGGSLRVLKTSHVGGHAYAGNVLVYCRGRSIDGDWFGGVHPGNADEFFAALVAVKAPSGAAGDAALRRWWRGRQVALRWRTSEVARLHCHGKHAVNMKQLVQQLEDATGGVVVHRAGGTVLLYRGDAWRPAAAQQGAALQAATQQGDAPTVQKAAAAQQADAAASPPAAASEGQLGQTADEQAPPPLQQHA
ncbi:Altered inheritance of mitochondria 32 [Micractinium conductrix]|uniref:Altered inheritance of mitochondria 32 n=1 Tax=Micractinium conductrix TaxID=554055 RepID=A0A2P6VA28_9CHLO|nr:Altered inheritance of mitochondria 32 [Micractinium conductrix]|eukprot:PSC70943.1 Altered inheritance of mitochondria 32 [Micractinium conductrix]